MGCPTTYDGMSATWAQGKLSRLTSGTPASGTEIHSFGYNALGQRVAKTYSFTEGTTPSYAGKLIGSTKKFYYDHSGRLIAEHTTKEYYDTDAENESIIFLYDGNTVIGMQHTVGGVTTPYYFHRNPLGDVIGILNTNGVMVAKYIYDAWGNCTISSDTTNITVAQANPIRYRGYYYDSETGLYYCNARYYSPKWRRFISPDDTSYLDPSSVNGLNQYCYCNNDPINYADPSGHSVLLTAAVIGLLVGAGLGGLYGGFTAAANAQNVIAGILIGAFAGGIMGAGAGVASLYLAPVIIGQTAFTVGGIACSAGTAVAIGTGFAFGSGVIGGMAADALTQVVNDGSVHDGFSIINSGVQWGLINTVSAILCSLGGPVSDLESGLLSAIFGSVTSAVGMTVDILRNK